MSIEASPGSHKNTFLKGQRRVLLLKIHPTRIPRRRVAPAVLVHRRMSENRNISITEGPIHTMQKDEQNLDTLHPVPQLVLCGCTLGIWCVCPCIDCQMWNATLFYEKIPVITVEYWLLVDRLVKGTIAEGKDLFSYLLRNSTRNQ